MPKSDHGVCIWHRVPTRGLGFAKPTFQGRIVLVLQKNVTVFPDLRTKPINCHTESASVVSGQAANNFGLNFKTLNIVYLIKIIVNPLITACKKLNV